MFLDQLKILIMDFMMLLGFIASRIIQKWFGKKLVARHVPHCPDILLEQIGFKLKSYNVETDDGYILQLFHIVSIKTINENADAKPVVLLQHGLSGTSNNWLVQQPNDSICLNLLLKHCDVWLGNSRGNSFSGDHKTYTSKQKEFWDFSFHEIGYYDLPATIDFIRKTTSNKKIHYVGYSQGSTVVFVLLSTRPEYNDKLASITALAPVAYLTNVKIKMIRYFSPTFGNILGIAKKLGYYRFGTSLENHKSIDSFALINKSYFIRTLVAIISSRVSKFTPDYVKEILSDLIMSHLHSGASTKQLAHYGQLIKRGNFSQYDYGASKNLQKYGQAYPPLYDLSYVKCPTTLLFSDSDCLTNKVDIEKLCEELPNVRSCKAMPFKDFDHMDFLWSGIGTEFILSEINSCIHS